MRFPDGFLEGINTLGVRKAMCRRHFLQIGTAAMPSAIRLSGRCPAVRFRVLRLIRKRPVKAVFR